MLYPTQFEEKIGFDKIRTLILHHCISLPGKELVAQMSFSDDFAFLREQLLQVDEFVRIRQEEEDIPINHVIDVRHSLRKIRVEGTYMEEGDLFDLVRVMENVQALVRYLSDEERRELYPALFALTEDVYIDPGLGREVGRVLDKSGHIKDNASPALAKIRAAIAETEGSVSRILHSILRSAQSEGLVDKDVTPTLRDGRLVIPIAPAFKRKIKGIVHDESATGKTVYVEPAQVVEANNRLRSLEADERREVIRILVSTADLIRPHAESILHALQLLYRVDFVRAKSLFAEQTRSCLPKLSSEAVVVWQQAVHPLLYLSLSEQGKSVVPLDIDLNGEQRLLLISGPNAGGKSVCLKSVGLIQYMFQCGLLIPVDSSSVVGVFERLFIDIGDEQSLENDLSTYSSHLTNMKHFLRHANARTLLLIDEFGGGTEPQIGGAIAETILERFVRSGAFGVITTHYQNLKHYAEERDGVVNGAMLYDRHRMQPLFRLAIGRPGSSFAIEIARKIGLPEDVISDASEKVGSVYVNMDKYLQDIVRDKNYWERKRNEIRTKEKQMQEMADSYENSLAEVKSERKQLLQKAKEEALALIAQSNATIENTIRKIKESQAEKDRTREARQELERLKREIEERKEEEVRSQMERLRRKQERSREKKSHSESTVSVVAKPVVACEAKPLGVGDWVTLKGETMVGELLEVKGKKAVVSFGSIKSTIALSRLEHSTKRQVKQLAKPTSVSLATLDDIRERKLNFRQEIDVRGMRGDEALQAVTYYIDDAILVGVEQVRILHGTGTGILRQLIREYLPTVSGVRHFHDEHVQFGGAGITVVEF